MNFSLGYKICRLYLPTGEYKIGTALARGASSYFNWRFHLWRRGCVRQIFGRRSGVLCDVRSITNIYSLLSSDRKEILPASHAIGVFGTLISQQVSGEKIGQSYFFISNSTLFRILVRFFLCALVQKLITLHVSPWRVHTEILRYGLRCLVHTVQHIVYLDWSTETLFNIKHAESCPTQDTSHFLRPLGENIQYCTQEMKGVTWALYTGSEGESHSHWQCIQEVKEIFRS